MYFKPLGLKVLDRGYNLEAYIVYITVKDNIPYIVVKLHYLFL